jgi:hypothetical protein
MSVYLKQSNTIFRTILRVRPFIICHFCQTRRRPFQCSSYFRTPFPSGDRNPFDPSSSSKHESLNPSGTTLQWLAAPSSMRVGGVVALNFPSDVFGETRLRTERAIAGVLSTMHAPRIEQVVIRLQLKAVQTSGNSHSRTM